MLSGKCVCQLLVCALSASFDAAMALRFELVTGQRANGSKWPPAVITTFICQSPDLPLRWGWVTIIFLGHLTMPTMSLLPPLPWSNHNCHPIRTVLSPRLLCLSLMRVRCVNSVSRSALPGSLGPLSILVSHIFKPTNATQFAQMVCDDEKPNATRLESLNRNVLTTICIILTSDAHAPYNRCP